MKYSNGIVYLGMFSEGLRHGKGMQTYPNGDLFRGFCHLGLPLRHIKKSISIDTVRVHERQFWFIHTCIS